MRSVSWPTFVRTATCFASTITPTDRPLRLVALCGSLRAASSNRALLEATAELAPEDFAVAQFTPASLPHFNADLEAADLPDPVQAWRLTVARCDGMLLSCPEYAAGLPGAFKNALDWLVGEPGFFRKPVAIHNASQRSVHAQKALRLVLRTMSADIVEEASLTLPLLGATLQPDDLVRNHGMTTAIKAALAAMNRHIRSTSLAT